MKLDTYNQPIYEETDIFNLMYQNNTAIVSQLPVKMNSDLATFSDISGISLCEYSESILPYDQFDAQNQDKWFIPDKYRQFDILEFCISKCTDDTQINRVCEEYIEFENRNMILLLQWSKYFVDTCEEHNILWGVGRGSSVASYLLYLIGIHRIDSIKYMLDWHEFLR